MVLRFAYLLTKTLCGLQFIGIQRSFSKCYFHLRKTGSPPKKAVSVADNIATVSLYRMSDLCLKTPSVCSWTNTANAFWWNGMWRCLHWYKFINVT